MREHNFTLLSYNIHKGFGPSRVRNTLMLIKKALEDINPDVICLQEVRGLRKAIRKKDHADPLSQVEVLAGEKWPYSAYGQNTSYPFGHHGNAILSKFPIHSIDNIVLSKSARSSRGLLYTELKISEKLSIPVVCIHFALSKRERFKHISALETYIRLQSPQGPLVVAGDFNDWKREDTRHFEDELNLNEAYKTRNGQFAKTYPALRPTLFNDRIYYRSIDLIDVTRLDEKKWRYLSDHLPLLVHFKIYNKTDKS